MPEYRKTFDLAGINFGVGDLEQLAAVIGDDVANGKWEITFTAEVGEGRYDDASIQGLANQLWSQPRPTRFELRALQWVSRGNARTVTMRVSHYSADCAVTSSDEGTG